MSDGRIAGLLFAITAWHGLAASPLPAQEDAAKPADSTRVLWRHAPDGARFADVLCHSGTVYALDRAGFIHALDAETGKPKWRTAGKEGFSWSYGMALSQVPGLDALFVASDTGLFALSYEDGKKLWHEQLEFGVAEPACTDKHVVAGSSDGKVYGFDPKSGKIVWEHDYMEDRPEDPKGFHSGDAVFQGRQARPRGATTDGKMVVLSIFDQCRAIALDAATGKRLWDYQAKGWMYGTPAIGPNNVFFGSWDRHVYGVDRQMGKLTWQVKTGARVEGGAQPTERFVYIGSCDANLYAIDQTVGQVMWKFETDKKKGYGGPIYSKPIVIGDTVYLATLYGVVYAVDCKTGKLRWRERPLANSELNSNLVHEDGRLFVTTRKARDKGHSAVLAIRAK